MGRYSVCFSVVRSGSEPWMSDEETVLESTIETRFDKDFDSLEDAKDYISNFVWLAVVFDRSCMSDSDYETFGVDKNGYRDFILHHDPSDTFINPDYYSGEFGFVYIWDNQIDDVVVIGNTATGCDDYDMAYIPETQYSIEDYTRRVELDLLPRDSFIRHEERLGNMPHVDNVRIKR